MAGDLVISSVCSLIYETSFERILDFLRFISMKFFICSLTFGDFEDFLLLHVLFIPNLTDLIYFPTSKLEDASDSILNDYSVEFLFDCIPLFDLKDYLERDFF